MSTIITQKAEENKIISERIRNFMKRFGVSSALKVELLTKVFDHAKKQKASWTFKVSSFSKR